MSDYCINRYVDIHFSLAVRPSRAHDMLKSDWEANAASRSATLAGEVHPVPFRTRKLRLLTPKVLRRQVVGD